MYFTIRAVGYLSVFIAIPGAKERCFAGEKLPASPPGVIGVGLPKSIFQRIPQGIQNIAAEPFTKFMKDQTGMDGKLHVFADSMQLAHQMNEGKIQLGIFQGFECAWTQAEYSDLVPLVVATPLEPCQAFCLVRWDCLAKNIGDLKGQKISLLPKQHDYCALYLTREKEQHMKGASFGASIDETSAIDAIFNVIEKKSACTIVDRATLKYFESAYPGKYKNLKILCQSEVFPDPCIAIKKGSLNGEAIEKLRSTLLNAQSQPAGQALLTLWKMKSFDKVSPEYEAQLKTIQKNYPAPVVTQAVER